MSIVLPQDLPLNVMKWEESHVRDLLQANNVHEGSIQILIEEEVSGRPFVKLTEEELVGGFGLERGPARLIAGIVEQLRRFKGLGTGRAIAQQTPVDVSSKIIRRWSKPTLPLPPIEYIVQFLEAPLPDDYKIPLLQSQYDKFISTDLMDTCGPDDLNALFRICNTETGTRLHSWLYRALMAQPPAGNGSESSFIHFWDTNIRDILELVVPGGVAIREGNNKTSTGPSGLDFGYLIRGICPFRGEEKGPNAPRDPRAELVDNLIWRYDPAPYLLGYFVRATELTFVALERPEQGQSTPAVRDIAKCNLAFRRERFKNVVLLVRLCSLFKPIADLVAWEGTAEFARIRREGKLIVLYPDSIMKTFAGWESHARIDNIINIYQRLEEKKVPHTDRLTHSHKKSDGQSGTVYLAPRGKDVPPKSPTDLFNAIRCVLRALEAAHAEPGPLFHRDLRWPNIVQSYDNPAEWIIIDWEDAGIAPTVAATHMNEHTHSPRVRQDCHGGEVDIWGVGQLIRESHHLHPAFSALGRKMREMWTVEEARQALDDVAQSIS